MLDGVLAREAPGRGLHHLRGALSRSRHARIAATGLAVFNDIITREAFARGLPLIDLRLIFNDDARLRQRRRAIVKGGAKIARAIADLVTTDDFKQERSVVFAG